MHSHQRLLNSYYFRFRRREVNQLRESHYSYLISIFLMTSNDSLESLDSSNQAIANSFYLYHVLPLIFISFLLNFHFHLHLFYIYSVQKFFIYRWQDQIVVQFLNFTDYQKYYNFFHHRQKYHHQDRHKPHQVLIRYLNHVLSFVFLVT